jgi:hypothetical protein
MDRLQKYAKRQNTTQSKSSRRRSSAAAQRPTSNTNVVNVDKPSWCSVRRLIAVVTVLLLAGAIGGVLLWKFLPSDARNALTALQDNGAPFAGSGSATAPPPDYPYIQCDDPDDVTTTSSSITNRTCCNGLPGACGQRIHEVVLAGVHNAQASAQDGFFVAPNHRYNVVEALNYGYRAINLDVGNCQGELSLVHGLCRLAKTRAYDTFAAINAWLDDHPTEVLIVSIQIDADAGGLGVHLPDLYGVLEQAGFAAKLYALVNGEAWPTLGEMVDSNRRVLFFHYNDDGWCRNQPADCPPGFHDWFSYAAETEYQFVDAAALDNKITSCAITRGQNTAPFFALNVFLTIPSPEVSADRLNTRDFLEDHMADCSTVNADRQVNIVFVDFWDRGDLPRVVQETYNRPAVLGINIAA